MNVEFSKSNIKTIRLILGIGMLLCIIMFFLIQKSQTISGRELYFKNKSEKIFNGIIVKKYIDKNNRSIPTLELNNNTKILLISNDWSINFQIGDYVLKEKDSLVMKLIKKGSQDTLYFDYRDRYKGM